MQLHAATESQFRLCANAGLWTHLTTQVMV